MKVSILAIVFWSVAGAMAHGYLDFANAGPGVNAPVSDARGNLILGPSPYVADLFWSSDINAPTDSLIPAGKNTPFSSLTNLAGYFFGGGVMLAGNEGVPVLAQVRVWDTNYGSLYYQARDNGGEFGFSNILIVYPSVPPGTPTLLSGLQSFQLQRRSNLSLTPTLTDAVLFTWPTNITSYVLQQSSSLDSTNWTTVASTPVVVGSQNQVNLPKPQGTMFYRLVSQ